MSSLISIPDYSHFIGKKYIIVEDITVKDWDSNSAPCKGMKFIIKNIKKNQAKIKYISSYEESMPAIMNFAAVLAKREEDELKKINKTIKMWTDEPHLFQLVNKADQIVSITGFNTPPDNPFATQQICEYTGNKSIGIKTPLYLRTDKKKHPLDPFGTYTNFDKRKDYEYYNLNFYELLKQHHTNQYNRWKTPDDRDKKYLFGFWKSPLFDEVSLKRLSKLKFTEFLDSKK